jgi:two-component system, response regulator YesN
MPYRVLVADDEEMERRALERILTSGGPPGIEVLEAANGAEAVAAAASAGGPLDAAFLDIRMPGIDGIEAARLLREATPGLPIIFLTAHDSFEYARSALRLRVEDFLLKPASAAEVLGALARATSEARGREGSRGDAALEDARAGARADARASAARLESAVSYLADEIRASLAAGRIDAEGIARYAELRGGVGSIAAVVAIRADRSIASSGGIALLVERALSREGRIALAGAGDPAGSGGPSCLCAVAAADAPGGSEAWLRPALESAIEEARAELGATIAVGAVAPDPAGRRGPGEGPAGEALAKAALRALALAGSSRSLVLLSIASSAGRAGIVAGEEGGSPGGAAARALELMEARYAEDLSLDGVAAELGVSPSHLSRLLGRQAGLGFADCLGRLRVEKAKAFLGAGRTSVKEAAAMVGFKDPAYFARVFRRFCGKSPAEYRALRGGEGGTA